VKASPKPIKLTLVTASLDVGGSERQMVSMVERLPRGEFETEFLLFQETGPLIARARSAGAVITTLGRPAAAMQSHGRSRVIRGADLTMRTALALRRSRPNVVDAWLFAAYVAVGLSRPFASTPAFVAGRRSLSDAKGAHGHFDHALGRLASRRADVIVANSNAVRADAISTDRDEASKVVVIRNGVEVRAPLSAVARAQIRARWEVDDDALVIVCVANYKPGKGIESLIDAYGPVAAEYPESRLVLMGEGPSRAALEKQARDMGLTHHVRLVGNDPEPGLSVMAADLAAHLSTSEGLPNAVLECSAAGLPVVATAVGGTAEIVLDGISGCLVSQGQESIVTTDLIELMGDKGLRKRMGGAGRAHAQQFFGMDRMAAEFAQLYRRLASVG
jgi:glycosyltransferase involved in cell wall biosynthesis